MEKLPRIPINRAVLEWDSKTKKVRVCFYGSEEPSGMEYAVGAINAWYRISSHQNQLFELMRASFIASLRDGIPLADIHEALSEITEYCDIVGNYVKPRRKNKK